MSAAVENQSAGLLAEEANRLRENWAWLLALGIVQIVAGMTAISFAFTATLASVMTLGVLLLIAAGAQVVAAVQAWKWSGFFLFLLVGVLYAVAGLVTLAHPLAAAEGLTLMIAAALLVGGVFRMVVAVVERFPSWGWVLVNGIVTALLGVAIWRQWPVSGLWVLGTFIGIEFIINGMTWFALALGVRSAVPRPQLAAR